ncbi:unnamed protein product [Allacma fusca]|uniref:Uncharacterized protein n=1 Tax=Allacma fusca TaxID=39272 RepID=A0A8J2LPN3_9HEXA|nr:unnamed protein product [Allacma fusca]
MCVGGRSKKNVQHELKLKSLLSSPGFWKLIQKLETAVSPGNSNIFNDALENHNAPIPISTPKDAPVGTTLSTTSSNSVANPISLVRSLKTVSETTSTESFAFQAITISPQRLDTESNKSPTTLENKTFSFTSDRPEETPQSSKYIQTVRQGQRKSVDENSSHTTSNVSERKSQNSSKSFRKTQRSRLNQETSSTDLRHKVRCFTQSHSVSACPKPRVPLRKVQTKKYNPVVIQTFRNPRATSRVPVSKPGFRRVSPINYNTKPKLTRKQAKPNSTVISNTSMESGKFSVNSMSPTSTSSHVQVLTKNKRKANVKPENNNPKAVRKVTEEHLSISSIVSSEVSKKLLTPTLASPGVSTYSEISLNRNKQENIPKDLKKEKSDFSLKRRSFQENLKMMQHHSIEYVYQNARRSEIELAARKDSGSIATKLSGKVDPVPQTDIYSLFYKSQIFDPNSKARKPKRYEMISSKIENPQKGIQVAAEDVNPTWKAGKLFNGSNDVQVEKGNQFVDVFKFLHEFQAHPTSRSPTKSERKSILKTLSKENDVGDNYNSRNFHKGKKRPSQVANNKPGSQVKKLETMPSKKGYLLRRLKTIFDNPNKVLGTAQDSTANSSLNLPVAPLSPIKIANKDEIVAGHVNNNIKNMKIPAVPIRVPYSKDTPISAGKTIKKNKKLDFKTVFR